MDAKVGFLETTTMSTGCGWAPTFTRLGLALPVVRSLVVPPSSRTNVTLASHAPEVIAPLGTTASSAIVETSNLTRIAVERTRTGTPAE